jgi:hypothetical protein
MKRIKISKNDVFRFLSSAEAWGYGQVLRTDIIQYIVVFRPELPINSKLEEIAMSPPLLCGWTSDARFYSDDWFIVGSAPAQTHFFPEYKVQISEKFWVTDVDGKVLRLATTREARGLPYKSSNSPIAFEKAFKAYHGRLPWESRFDELLCNGQ